MWRSSERCVLTGYMSIEVPISEVLELSEVVKCHDPEAMIGMSEALVYV